MAGYIRQSTFVDGDTITAALFNNEYNQLVNAFSNTSGHKHDGTTAEGPVIGLIGDAGETSPNNKVLIDTTNNHIEFYVEVSSNPVQQIYIADGAIVPVTDSDVDLGTSSLYFKDAYIDTVTTTGNVAVGGNLTVTGTTTFNGGTITMGDAATDNVVFGADVDSHIIPDDDDTYDLGSSTQEWRNLYIDGTAHIDTLDVDANATVAGTLGVTGVLTGTSLDISGDIDVDGTTNLDVVDIDGAVDMATTLTVAGNVDFNGDLDVDGTTNLDVVDIDGAVDMASTLTLAGNADFNGDLDVDGTTNLDVVDIDGAVDMATTLTVGGEITAASLDISGNVDIDGTLETDALSINSTTVTSTAAELNILDGVTSTAAELNILDGVTSTTAELNILDGVTATATEINLLDGVTSTTAELNILDGVTATAAEINTLDGITSTVAELNILDGVTASATDINLIDGITNGTVIASKAIVTDANKDITGGRNITITGELDAATLDISGNADIDGTLEADAITIGGVTLAETISDTVGAMVSSNTETNITVTYDDTDNTLDFVIGTLNQDTTGNAATATALETARTIGGVSFDGTANINLPGVNTAGNQNTTGNASTATLASTVTVSDSTANTNFPVVFHNESNGLLDDTGALRYNPSTGELLVPKLTVSGTTTQVDTVTMNASNAIVFEGATADANETTLSIVDPTSDHTQYLINQGGYIPVLAAATTTQITATPAELNILDGVTSTTAELNILDGVTSTASELNLLDGSSANTVVNSKAVIYGSSGQVAGTLSTAAQPNITSLGTLSALVIDDITINGSNITDSGDIYIDVGGDIHLDADGGDIRLKDAGTEWGRLVNNSSNFLLLAPVADKDIMFNGVDGSSEITALYLDMSDAGTAIFNHDIKLPDSGKAIFGAGSDLQIYHDGSNSYFANGTGATLITGSGVGNIAIKPKSDEDSIVAVPNGNVQLYYDGTKKLETTSTGIDVTGSVTADSLTVDDITINGSTISDAGTLTVDSGGEIHLNAETNGVVRIQDGGSNFGALFINGSEFTIKSELSNNDFVIAGNDNGTSINAVRFDMSQAGTAIFNHDIKLPDSGQAIFGADSDLSIYHDNSTGNIVNNTGVLNITNNDIRFKTSGAETMLRAIANGAVKLMYNNDTKLETTNGGVDIAGTLTTSGLLTVNDGAIFNEGSEDKDFRVESNGNAYMLWVDGGNDKVHVATSAGSQTDAPFNTRRNGSNIEFGHSNNTAGYYGTLGAWGSAGHPFLGLSTDCENSANTFSTRGSKGNLIYSNTTSGDLVFAQLTTASATGQTPTERMRLDSSGGLTLTPDDGGHVVFNEGSSDADFRVETTSYTHGFFVNAGNSRVGINDSSPDRELEVRGDDASTSHTVGIKVKNTNLGTGSIAGIVFENYDNNAAYIRSIRSGSTAGILTFGINDSGSTAESSITEKLRISSFLVEPESGVNIGSIRNNGVTVGTSATNVLNLGSVNSSGDKGKGRYLVTICAASGTVGTAGSAIYGLSSSGAVYLYETVNADSVSFGSNGAQVTAHVSSGSYSMHVNAIPLSVDN